MTRNGWLITVVAILLLGGGGYGACAMPQDTGYQGEPLSLDPRDVPGIDLGQGIFVPAIDAGNPLVQGEGPTVDVPMDEDGAPLEPEHSPMDVGDAPDMDVPAAQGRLDAEEGALCGDVHCAPDEACCHPLGMCYPADCTDCCQALMNMPGEEPSAGPGGDGPGGPEPPPDPAE